ncbi:MAG TPA: hypothetical protein DCX06_11770 [Opitutae bacterium]|nr:hypothetical protein [Opitutae bacterium]
MDLKDKLNQRSRLLLTLWCLLFIKCLSLEFCVTYYSVPIDSKFYVWALSIFMATFATLLSFKASGSTQDLLTPHRLIWLACIIGGAACATIAKLSDDVSALIVLPTTALLIGSGYIAQGLLLKQRIDIASGAGWWTGAAILFRVDTPHDYLIAAVCVFIFSLAPTLIRYLQVRRKIKRASVD